MTKKDYAFTECVGADTICEYKNCKKEAQWERANNIDEDLKNKFTHRCNAHKLL
mgnify:CR=1 FL=1